MEFSWVSVEIFVNLSQPLHIPGDDSKHFDLAIKLDFLFCQNFDYVSDFARGTKTETKTEFSSDFVLKTKSNFDFWPFVACVPCKNQN